jgi:glycosyltransferase involved in cell wall biosynthesis
MVVAIEPAGSCNALLAQDLGDAESFLVPRTRKHGFDPILVHNLARLFERLRPDIVHTHNWATGLYGILAGRKAGVRRVVHAEHGRESLGTPPWRRRLIARTVAPLVRTFAAVCFDLAREIETLWGAAAKKVWLIPNGVDLARFKPSEDERSRFRGSLSLPDDAFVVGTVAGIRAVKDLPTMIRGVRKARELNPKILLVIVGADGVGRDQDLRALIAREDPNGIRLVRHRRDIPSVLAGFDAYLNTSLYEGFSMSIAEAMAAGLPVVATRVGGTPELVEPGRTGQLVEAGDVDAVARAVIELAASPERARQLGRQARSHAEASLGIDTMIGRYDALYQSVLSPA